MTAGPAGALLRGAEAPEERVLYWVWGTGRKAEAIRKGDWKLLRNRPGMEWHLFNLANDPNEEHDLFDQMPEKVAELKALLEAEKARDAPRSRDK